MVRHGETDWNKARRIQGQVDIPLNAFGRHLAEETGKGLADIPFEVCGRVDAARRQSGICRRNSGISLKRRSVIRRRRAARTSIW